VGTGIEKTRVSGLVWLESQVIRRDRGAETAPADLVK
jgi:hypothetical protein